MLNIGFFLLAFCCYWAVTWSQIICSSPQQCQNQNILCTQPGCSIKCSNDYSCANSYIICYGSCSIICSGNHSCYNTTFSLYQSTNLICSGNNSCYRDALFIASPNVPNNVICNATQSCANMGVWVSTNFSYNQACNAENSCDNLAIACYDGTTCSISSNNSDYVTNAYCLYEQSATCNCPNGMPKYLWSTPAPTIVSSSNIPQTAVPSNYPTPRPTPRPTTRPTTRPTKTPTFAPTFAPSPNPINFPSWMFTTTNVQDDNNLTLNNTILINIESSPSEFFMYKYIHLLSFTQILIIVSIILFSLILCCCIILIYCKYKQTRQSSMLQHKIADVVNHMSNTNKSEGEKQTEIIMNDNTKLDENNNTKTLNNKDKMIFINYHHENEPGSDGEDNEKEDDNNIKIHKSTTPMEEDDDELYDNNIFYNAGHITPGYHTNNAVNPHHPIHFKKQSTIGELNL